MTIDKLEQAVSELPPGKFQEFSTWFEEYKAQQWDEQIERDAKAGRLDEHIQKARETYRSGQSQPLPPLPTRESPHHPRLLGSLPAAS